MIPETLIYSSATGRNACNGDSGGPSFWVSGGVEYLAGVTSSGDDACMLDDTQQRSDQPYIDQFIQAQIDAFEGNDPCRSNGICDESCNTGGQLGDPDCAQNHCGADGVCAEACVAPRDPDCEALDSNNCGDNGVCDLTCPSDPDCIRDCAAEGNCIPRCPTPDPDCAGDGGTRDAGVADAPPADAVHMDVGGPEVAAPDVVDRDVVVVVDANPSSGADAAFDVGGTLDARSTPSPDVGEPASGCSCRAASGERSAPLASLFVVCALLACKGRRRQRRSYSHKHIL